LEVARVVGWNEQVRAFLSEPRFAVLATINPDGTPQQTVMWYLLRGETIVMNTARGRKKDRNLLRDRRVSICVEDHYRYVTIAGVLELVEDQATAQADIEEMAVRYHGPEKAATMVRDQFSKQERITLHLPITDLDVHGFEDHA
jgi:PPOX class probable F420-dependent enzyme